MLLSNHICILITAVENLRRPLKPHYPVIAGIGAHTVSGKVVLLGAAQLMGGESSPAQLLLDERVPSRMGMPVTLSEIDGSATLASGEVLLPGLRRIRTSGRQKAVELLKKIELRETVSAIESLVDFCHPGGITHSFIRNAMGLGPEELNGLSTKMRGIVEIKLRRDTLLIDEKTVKLLSENIIRLIKEYHIENPHKAGPDSEYIRERLKPPSAMDVINHVLNELASRGVIVEEDGIYRMAEFKPTPEDPLEGLKGEVYRLYEEMGYSPDHLRESARILKQPERRLYGILKHLRELGYIIQLDKSTFITKAAFDSAWEKARSGIATHGDIELGEFRDELECGRNIALLLLERFDKKSWTERRGGVRIKGPKFPAG